MYLQTKLQMKTKPYGVRFFPEKMELLKNEQGISTPQRAVNFLFDFWIQNKDVNNAVLKRIEILEMNIKPMPKIEELEERILDTNEEFKKGIFRIEDYTEYPESEKPKNNPIELKNWNTLKKVSDNKIRERYKVFLENNKNK